MKNILQTYKHAYVYLYLQVSIHYPSNLTRNLNSNSAMFHKMLLTNSNVYVYNKFNQRMRFVEIYRINVALALYSPVNH